MVNGASGGHGGEDELLPHHGVSCCARFWARAAVPLLCALGGVLAVALSAGVMAAEVSSLLDGLGLIERPGMLCRVDSWGLSPAPLSNPLVVALVGVTAASAYSCVVAFDPPVSFASDVGPLASHVIASIDMFRSSRAYAVRSTQSSAFRIGAVSLLSRSNGDAANDGRSHVAIAPLRSDHPRYVSAVVLWSRLRFKSHGHSDAALATAFEVLPLLLVER